MPQYIIIDHYFEITNETKKKLHHNHQNYLTSQDSEWRFQQSKIIGEKSIIKLYQIVDFLAESKDDPAVTKPWTRSNKLEPETTKDEPAAKAISRISMSSNKDKSNKLSMIPSKSR